MKKIFRLSAVLPLALIIAGCSSDKEQPVAPLEGDFDVVMSVLPSDAETRATKEQLGNKAENYIQNDRLFFGTYNSDGTLKDAIYEAGEKNAAVKAHFFIPWWGPSVAAKLPKEDYKDGFYTASFSIPKKMNGGTSLKSFNDAAFATLTWPDKNTVWTPDTLNDNYIPMAALNQITAEYMSKYYNGHVYDDNNPLRLPDLKLTRALAKIVIEDVDGIIKSATLRSPDKGSLVPDVATWMNSASITKPVTAPGATWFDQTLESPNVDDKYVFYTFESTFYNADGTLKGAADTARELITLIAKDSRLGTTKVSIAPYVSGSPNISVNSTLATLDKGSWQGVMRNTIYYFRVHRPSVGGVEIEVKAGNWEDYKETFKF